MFLGPGARPKRCRVYNRGGLDWWQASKPRSGLSASAAPIIEMGAASASEPINSHRAHPPDVDWDIVSELEITMHYLLSFGRPCSILDPWRLRNDSDPKIGMSR